MSEELGDFSMLELFRLEVDNQTNILSDGLLALEQNAGDGAQLEALMRAAHSIKGAARMVDVEAGVRLAHTMEDAQVDLLLKGVDQLIAISRQETDDDALEQLCQQIRTIAEAPAACAIEPNTEECTAVEQTGQPVSDNDLPAVLTIDLCRKSSPVLE